MIFQNDDDLYRPRRTPWGTILLSAFCVLLALGLVFGIRNHMKKQAAAPGETPPSVAIPADQVAQPVETPVEAPR